MAISDFELQFLKDRYPRNSNKRIAEVLGKTERAVRSRAQYWGIKKSNRYWTQEQELYIKNWYGIKKVAEICKHLNKTKWAVINKHREIIAASKIPQDA